MRVGRKLRKPIVEQKKTKPCFVRLEKVQEEKQEALDRNLSIRKLTGPLKKRPFNTPIQVAKKVEEATTTVASTRTRRAPKPNPKYANADIITPRSKGKKGKGLYGLDDGAADESDSTEDYYNALDEASNDSDTNYADGGEVFDAESSDFSEIDEMQSKIKKPTKSAPPTSNTAAPVTKRGVGRPRTRLSPVPSSKMVDSKKALQSQNMPQRTTNLAQQQQGKKRKLDSDEEDEPPESIIARNKRLNIALYDSNVMKPLAQQKMNTYKASGTIGGARVQSPTQKKTIPNTIKSTSSLPKDSPEDKNKSPLLRRSPTALSKSTDALDSASTQDDFETMPTFTIVNIHDIINKKGDCLVQKNNEEKKESTSPNTPNRLNRRKTGHTTILSEKLDPSKIRTPLSRTPFPPKKTISTILNSTSLQRPEPRKQLRPSLPTLEKKTNVSNKPAPRILNSVVAKRTYPVQPILGKLDNDIGVESSEDNSDKNQMVKENVGSNKTLPMKPSLPRKLPPEKVFVQRQGNKLIKKITCFETWYVINIPETQEPVVKNCLDIPLITLSNAAKSIRLPSSAWSTKVTLYKLSNQMLGKSTLIPFTGDLSDQSIPEEDRDKYQPSCVMFRRMTQQKSRTRMPYDRAVIFKMKTFFTNIDGKNVRLIGAPSTISSFEEIEVLLELVDELDLLHDFVEPASTV